jgi:hypothetical protein
MLRITQSPGEILRHRVLLIEPIDQIFCAVQSAVEGKRNNPTEPVPKVPLGLDLEDLGAPVAAMATLDGAARAKYIAQVLSIATRNSKHGKRNAEEFLSTNRYLFWDMPLSVLRRCDPLPNNEFEILPSSGAPVGFPAAVDYLEGTLSKVGEDEWTTDAISEVLSKAAKNIFYHTPRDQEGAKTRPAYLILRRAFCGIDHGPGVAQIMVLLGRAETMTRVRALRDVDWSSAQNSRKILSSAEKDL